jgi:hypothetical protein
VLRSLASILVSENVSWELFQELRSSDSSLLNSVKSRLRDENRWSSQKMRNRECSLLRFDEISHLVLKSGVLFFRLLLLLSCFGRLFQYLVSCG